MASGPCTVERNGIIESLKIKISATKGPPRSPENKTTAAEQEMQEQKYEHKAFTCVV